MSSDRVALARLAALLALTWASLEAPTAVAQTAQDSVQAVFESYRAGLLAADGPAVVRVVSRGTVDQYGRAVALALDADSAQVRGLDLADRLLVLSLRHRIPADTVRAFDGRGALAYGVAKGWIDGVSLRLLTIERVEVNGDQATALTNAGEGSTLPFVREAGNWRIDLAAMSAATEAAFSDMAADAGQSVDEFLLFALGVISGRPVGGAVWYPLGRP